jgi:hypothetical protein
VPSGSNTVHWGGGKITGPHMRSPVDLPGSDFRIRADGTAIEPVTGATHTFGFALTESGDRFTDHHDSRHFHRAAAVALSCAQSRCAHDRARRPHRRPARLLDFEAASVAAKARR